VLDGRLLGEHPAEVNLAELLHIAQREFKDVKTMDEEDLEQDWPRLRVALGRAFIKWKSEPCETEMQIVKILPFWRQVFNRR
jgi:hypothetical protein